MNYIFRASNYIHIQQIEKNKNNKNLDFRRCLADNSTRLGSIMSKVFLLNVIS